MLITHLLTGMILQEGYNSIPFFSYILVNQKNSTKTSTTPSEFTPENRPSHPSNRRSSSNRAPFFAEGYVSRCSFKREGLPKTKGTPRKTHISVENCWLEDETSFFIIWEMAQKIQGRSKNRSFSVSGWTVDYSLKLICPVLLDRWPIIGITILCHHRVNHQLFRDGTLQRLPRFSRGGWVVDVDGWNTPKQTVRF